MLPSSCLNVVLEEVEGQVDTAKTDLEPNYSCLRDLISSPLRQDLSIPGFDNSLAKSNNNNNNEAFIGLDYGKKLPEAFLSECTVEPCKPSYRKILAEPRFEVLLLPIYKCGNNENYETNDRNGDWRVAESERGNEDWLEHSSGEIGAIPEVEAVYSDHDSQSDQEIVFQNHCKEMRQKGSSVKEENVKTHMCKFCHKIFPNKGVLWVHINVSHSHLINCDCPICGRVFHRNCNLAVHLKSHEAEGIPIPDNYRDIIRPYLAPPSDAISPSTTTAPIIPDRPFKCPYCTKSYSQRSVLKKHMVVHTGERLTCNLCGIDFTQKSSLLRHTKRLHSSNRPSFTKTPRKVPPLLNLRLTDHLKKVLSDIPKATSRLESQTSPKQNTDTDDSSKHSSEETEHSVDVPNKVANFIQSLKIPQGISISMIDD